jgi:4-hydroxy-tetrahydrodipicolinate reductase
MLKIVQIGIGPIGQKIVQFALKRSGVQIVAAVDPAPDKVGRDLGEYCSSPALGITICKDLKSALKGKKANVAVLTTVSSIKSIAKQIEEIAKAELNIVSICEELSFPWRTHPGM